MISVDSLNTALSSRYRIERELGRGGMAVVYLAHDTELDRDVALKVLDPELTASIQAQRFLREIEIAARLSHPNILTLHDHGRSGGKADGRSADLLYYTMPYVEGGTLRDRLDREKQLPIDEALRIAAQVADALQHAHERGVVHRDIKPENILLQDSHVLVSDFGVARAVTEAGGEKLTQTGITVGTVSYMSPEQAAGDRDIDGRSDLYSLGCVLYEMIGGVPPFTGPSDQAILARHSLEAPPALSTIRSSTPSGVQALIEKSLAKTPADRHASAEHLRLALSDPAITTGGAVARAGWIGKSRWARVVVAVAVLAAVALGVWRLLGGGAPFDPHAGVVAVLPFEVDGGLERPLDAVSVAQLLRNYFGYTERFRSVRGFRVEDAVEDLCPTPPIERFCGSQVATALGAQFHVTGTVAPVLGDSVQIVAYLTDEMTGRVIAPVSVRASLADAYVALDRLFSELAAATAGEGERVVALAGIATDQPAALAAFLDGELYLSEFHNSNTREARGAFQRAVDIDSTFALAWYRLAILWDWDGNPAKMFHAIEQAESHSGRLSEHDRRFVVAFRLLIAGDVDQAEMVYLDLLEEDPNDVEALFQLGLMRWAYNWRRGRSAAEAIEPLQRFRELVPKDCMGAIYLMWGLTAAGDADGLTTLKADTDEACGGQAEVPGPSIQAIRAYRVGDSAAYMAAMDSIAVDAYLGGLVFLGTMHGAVPDIAHLAAIERAYPTPDPDTLAQRRYYFDRILAATILAGLELGGGRRTPAWLALERLDSLLPVTPAIAYLGSLATILPGAVPPDNAATVAARLAVWDPPTRDEWGTNRYGSRNYAHSYWGPYERPYLLGLLASQAGDYRMALEYADELEAMPPFEYFPSINADLALSVRADVRFNEGQPAEALAALDSARWGINYNEVIYAPMVGGQREVFLKAMVLQELGRYPEALAFYSYGIEHSMPGPLSFPLLAPSHLYRGQIYEDMGDIEQALWHYDAFVELWREADPEYQPMVADARERMARLTSELGAGS